MKGILLAAIILTTGFVSCKKETEVIKKVPVLADPVVSEECYSGVLQHDTVAMQLNRKGNQVTGKLAYRFFEKDKNQGTIAGQIKGDTLFAIYTFNSEGQSSKREVVFLKKGQTYTEGYGETTVDPDGNPIFKDQKHLKFDSKLVLSVIDCP